MKGKIIVALIALIMLAGGGAAGYFGGAMIAPPKPVKPAPVEVKPAGPPDRSLFVDMPQMLVALHSSIAGSPVLQLSVTIQCSTSDDVETLKSYLPRVLDVFQSYVGGMRVEDFRGTENLEKFRKGLIKNLLTAIKPGKVDNVLFQHLTIR
jgi:flagellar FliL protein